MTKEQKLVNEVEQLNIGVSNLSVTIEELKHNLKCDATGWNIAEALSSIYFELKRANDIKEGIKK